MARAQAPAAGREALVGSGVTGVSGWWGAGGRAGWLPDGDLSGGHPWSLAGLVAGTWVLEEVGRSRPTFPSPGGAGAQSPLAWFDTLAVSAGEGGAWEGFEAGLARVRAGLPITRTAGDGRRPRTEILIANGSYDLRDNAASLWRGDSLGGLRLEAASGERGVAGGVTGSGRDLYGIAAGSVRGAHRVEAGFTHRRSNAQLVGGESEDIRGEAGAGSYGYEGDRWRLGATLSRGYDRHDSRGGAWLEQRRLADATAAAVTVARRSGSRAWGVRGSWRESGVRADADSGGRERARALWGAARWQIPLGEGDLELALGAGHHTAVGRTPFAPSLVWSFRGSPWRGRVTFGRVTTPVWTDLAPGQSPFLQDTWAGGLDLGLGVAGGTGAGAGVGFLVGRTAARALVGRLPLESLARRAGFRADPGDYDFGLLLGEAHWRTRRWGASIEGFALAHDASALQPQVDPARGGRIATDLTFRMFQGDLVVRPRLEAWAVGARESEASPSRPLPGYGILGAALELTIADATVLIEGRDLADRRGVRTWVDSMTGIEVTGPGRELRVALNWRLWD